MPTGGRMATAGTPRVRIADASRGGAAAAGFLTEHARRVAGRAVAGGAGPRRGATAHVEDVVSDPGPTRLSNCRHAAMVPRSIPRPNWPRRDLIVADAAPCEDRAVGTPGTPDWWEDTDLAVAVAEVEEFAAAAGWDAPPQMFALVTTADLIAAEPSLAASLAAAVPVHPDRAGIPAARASLPRRWRRSPGRRRWPAACSCRRSSCCRPRRGARLSADPDAAAAEAAAHPDRAEARLAAGVLRDGEGRPACCGCAESTKARRCAAPISRRTCSRRCGLTFED